MLGMSRSSAWRWVSYT